MTPPHRPNYDVGTDTDMLLLPVRNSRDEKLRAVQTVLREIGERDENGDLLTVDMEVLRMLLAPVKS